jgi:hypothetical protein
MEKHKIQNADDVGFGFLDDSTDFYSMASSVPLDMPDVDGKEIK